MVVAVGAVLVVVVALAVGGFGRFGLTNAEPAVAGLAAAPQVRITSHIGHNPYFYSSGSLLDSVRSNQLGSKSSRPALAGWLEVSLDTAAGGSGHGQDGSVEVTGVVGPGLVGSEVRDPAAYWGRPPAATAGHPATVGVGLAVDCTRSSRWWTGSAGDYRVDLVRTDPDGRVTVDDAPITATDRSWDLRSSVQNECLHAVSERLAVAEVAVAASPGNPRVKVSARVRNDNDFPVWIQGVGTAQAPGGPVSRLAPGTQTVVVEHQRIDSCNRPHDQGVGLPGVRVGVVPLPPAPATGPDPHHVWLGAGKVRQDWSGDPCAGAPALTHTITAASPISARAPQVGWRIEVQLATDADAVVGFRADRGSRLSRLGFPDSVPVVNGRGQATIFWTRGRCGAAWSPSPPEIYVVLGVGDRRYPTYLKLDGYALYSALAENCHAGSDPDWEQQTNS